ncbi:HDIG domain-containing protein [Thermoanaerobacter uzonensis DSM 18761]|jgi:putative nucleotidyltransferase with HDIG domain|uniref:HDIG domain-containing protein n=1 Tax=Thermoanaerobacter uzonensis DSM 18761 TaxID=1123369 RepID=A0A1M4Y2P6_9THEO|nr:HD domain-containing protein [Thermoanaerobacter uzonensis]SHE99843.1 HDIG domain-containing protein [Thermoanaerobacter uzonensis DSM 18761]
MDRNTALALVKEYVSDETLINHMIATGAIMGGLAERFGQDVERWVITGILHDIDYQETKDNPELHSIRGGEILTEHGLDEEIVHAVMAHNEIHGIERITLLDKALFAVDPLSGLITATAYVMPSKKLEEVQLKSLKKKFKDKTFAKGANRDQIKTCEEFGISLDEFLEIALNEMKKIAPQIGL